MAQTITPFVWFDGRAEEAAVLGAGRWRWAGRSARAGAW